ncbi:MAG: hypothetical protein ACYTXA_21040 [Nostoc sp.]
MEKLQAILIPFLCEAAPNFLSLCPCLRDAAPLWKPLAENTVRSSYSLVHLNTELVLVHVTVKGIRKY